MLIYIFFPVTTLRINFMLKGVALVICSATPVSSGGVGMYEGQGRIK